MLKCTSQEEHVVERVLPFTLLSEMFRARFALLKVWDGRRKEINDNLTTLFK